MIIAVVLEMSGDKNKCEGRMTVVVPGIDREFAFTSTPREKETDMVNIVLRKGEEIYVNLDEKITPEAAADLVPAQKTLLGIAIPSITPGALSIFNGTVNNFLPMCLEFDISEGDASNLKEACA